MKSTKKVAKEMSKRLKNQRKVQDELCHPGVERQCAGMKMAMQGSGKRGMQYTWLLSKSDVDTCIAYKPPVKGAKLIIFNYCPFCGRDIKPPKRGP